MNLITCDYSIVYGKDQLGIVVDHLLQHMRFCKIFCFNGTLGSGKTTLVKRLLHYCGIQEGVVSPTFTLVNTYKNKENILFHHFDLYRISSIDEFISSGFHEYLYEPNSIVLIEWPEIINPLLEEAICLVTLEYYSDTKRLFSCALRGVL